MKIVIVLLSVVSFLPIMPQACGQPQNKKGQSKDLVMASRSNWLPSSIKQTRDGNSWIAMPTARITGQQRENRSESAVENIVLKSTDGGQTWQDVSEGLPDNRLREGFFSTNSGFYLRAGEGIYHSNPTSPAPFWVKELCPDQYSSIAPSRRGIIAFNYSGQIVQKIEGAWTPIFTNFKEQLVRSVFETSSGTVFIGCDKGLFKSTTNGKTWRQVNGGGWVIKLVEANGILMATSQQGIIRSTDDGENWDLVISEGGVGIAIESINGGFAAITYNTQSETRRVRTSYDNGKNWQPIDGGLPAHASIASIVQFGEYLFCGHPSGIFKSSDLGKTWKLLLPAVGGKVFNLSVSGSVIYAIPRNVGC